MSLGMLFHLCHRLIALSSHRSFRAAGSGFAAQLLLTAILRALPFTKNQGFADSRLQMKHS
jgi:hypothetical protein